MLLQYENKLNISYFANKMSNLGKRGGTERSEGCTIEKLYQIYKTISNYHGMDASKPSFWKKALSTDTTAKCLKDIGVDGVMEIWRLITEKTGNNVPLFKSLFKDYERTLTDNLKLHENIRTTLETLFFNESKALPTQQQIKRPKLNTRSTRSHYSEGITEMPTRAKPRRIKRIIDSEESALSDYEKQFENELNQKAKSTNQDEEYYPSEEEDKNQNHHISQQFKTNTQVVSDFKILTKQRFEGVDLNLLVRDEEHYVNLTELFDVQDFEIVNQQKNNKCSLKFRKLYKMIGESSLPQKTLNHLFKFNVSDGSSKKQKKGSEKQSIGKGKKTGKMEKARKKEEEKELDLNLIKKELKRLQGTYKLKVDELSEMYTKVSGDFKELEKLLEGKDVEVWDELEDLALQSSPHSKEYAYLLREKGHLQVNKRNHFLKFNPFHS